MLKGKVALITGGTAGIGKAIALLFAANGADVIILGTNQERAEQTVQEMGNGKHAYFLADVSKTGEIEAVVEKILKDWGKVDILVNNAGITKDNLLMKMSEADWDAVMAVNLKSVYNTCKALTRAMMKNRSGVILNITSVIGLTGNAGQANYAASKAGMVGFTKSIAKELASRGIRANCIAPGYIKTSMTEVLKPEVKEAIIGEVPLGRIGEPNDIAQAALFLASDQACYITGQVLTVDGGMVI
jgi:3-oxoacyl-[acyl-carrier protein] reductase